MGKRKALYTYRENAWIRTFFVRLQKDWKTVDYIDEQRESIDQTAGLMCHKVQIKGFFFFSQQKK